MIFGEMVVYSGFSVVRLHGLYSGLGSPGFTDVSGSER